LFVEKAEAAMRQIGATKAVAAANAVPKKRTVATMLAVKAVPYVVTVFRECAVIAKLTVVDTRAVNTVS
jgi:hypothetical protein